MGCDRYRCILCLVVVMTLAGCGGKVTPRGTGAREAVQKHFEAIIHQDWETAYGNLDPESRARCALDEFIRLAQNYRQHLGFEPQSVTIRACDENGADATAYAVLKGTTDAKAHRFRDAVTLRQVENQWGVVLPPRFGR